MTTTMIQRMAEAMARELARQDGWGLDVVLDENLKVAYLDQGEVDFGLVARALLEAMSEMTDAMVVAALDYAPDIRDIWKAAIRAALHETKDAVGREGE